MNNIWITGDVHSNTSSFKQRINSYIQEADETDSLICLGDVGIKYGEQTQGSLRKEMKKFPGTIYVMRGNHDTRYWRDYSFDDSWVVEDNLLYQKKYDNIKYIKDWGGLYNINDNNILFIPGAYSIDKYYRLNKGYPYEFDEQLSWKEQNSLYDLAIANKNNIDYVCSHTAPYCTQPYYKDLFLSFIDQSQIDNHMEKFLDEIYSIVGKNVKRWYFGHYHDDRNVSTNFTMLYTKIVKLGEKVEG